MRIPSGVTSPDPYYRFDYGELIKYLGGATALTAKLKKKGYGTVNRNNVYQWQYRNSIPSPWAPYIFALAIEEKIFIDLPEELPKLPF
jgi:hypothetical protein